MGLERGEKGVEEPWRNGVESLGERWRSEAVSDIFFGLMFEFGVFG